MLRDAHGIELRVADVTDAGELDMEDVEAKLADGKVGLVAITHMSNVLGTVTPIKEIIRLAHARGIPVMVDGSQGAVHLDVDVRDLDADFYVFTGHKVYGPTGIGVLYGKKKWLERMPPYSGGGEMIRDVTLDDVTYGAPPHRFEAGTPPIVQAIGLGAAIDYMNGIGREAIQAHENSLRDYAMERLGAMNSLRIFGRAKDKGAIVAFEMKGAHAHDVATVIDRSGVAVRAGTHCAQPLLRTYGVTSTCRASFAVYNTIEEVDRLVEALQKAEALFS
jgi:cysteine desulfurase/selenocysteine lyase